MNTIKKIQNWYMSNCDGEWEHQYGVKIETLDNPGWSVEVDLNKTKYENKSFTEINIDNGDEDWIRCRVSDKKFLGDGDPNKLKQILKIFIDYSEK